MTTTPRSHAARRGGWIRRYHESRGTGPALVCCPHAGGSASAYFSLSAALSGTADVLIAQYPGRQDRIGEAPLEDIGQLADQLAEALAPWQERPLALFGHSMGSVVAYETALRLERSGHGPVGLIVSGRAAPSVRQDRGIHRLDDAGIAAQLAELAGTPQALFEDPELLETVLPPVRADFRAVETYQDLSGGAVGCPLSAYCGRDDTDVPRDGFLAWGGHTTAAFRTELFEGGHFYLQDREREVAQAIARDLASFA
ncbi:thioesterase II family protein [Streptomyces boncukensis]|uniref:Thioesterase n=1 Tax=Streptomyces boncukensis TaxID=2711219 RepID=A0A6G4WWY2_9ACTN|nr:alpha/beta fold hydrolase [Streptomyces boncukensis]NGO69523.1 thioesterase [Streptomyces boncukensis]